MLNPFSKTRRYITYAQELKKFCERYPNDIYKVIEEVVDHRKFTMVQKRYEIYKLLRLINQKKPKTICDIGSAGGGTLRLFCHYAHPQARIITIDLNNNTLRQKSYPHLAQKGQQITIFQGSSYDPKTIDYVKQWLRNELFDFVFIDGDHEYDGVKKDFLAYSALTNKGGLIGFHDIVPDHKTVHGSATPGYAGGVHKLWEELRLKYPEHEEFIQDSDQDGQGIGLIHWK